jgi:DNA-binding HxlR family transcriptional regulator
VSRLGPPDVVDSVLGTAEAVGDAWSWLIISDAIIEGTSRFDEFQRRLAIARSTLSNRLAALCAHGVMARRGRDYVLTDCGEDLLGWVMTAMAWGDRWYSGRLDMPLRVAHVGCAEKVHGQLRCASCDEVVRAHDVSFDRRPPPLGTSTELTQRQRASSLVLLQRLQPHSIAATLQVIGDRWSALVIRELFYGLHRFDELQQRLGIATNILSARLRRLVEHGVVDKRVYLHHPIRHEYRLTEKGLDLYPVPLSMLAWGDRWLTDGLPAVRLTHRPCGRHLRPLLTCSVCAHPVTRTDLVFERSTQD